MTTVVYRAGVIACDSQVSQDTAAVGSVVKIVRTPKGGLAGAAGELGAMYRFLMWAQAGADGPIDLTEDDIDGFVVRPDGKIFVTADDGTLVPMTAEFHAVGSGRDFARGALAMGASAEEAVRAAIKFDGRSGGRVQKLAFRKQ